MPFALQMSAFDPKRTLARLSRLGVTDGSRPIFNRSPSISAIKSGWERRRTSILVLAFALGSMVGLLAQTPLCHVLQQQKQPADDPNIGEKTVLHTGPLYRVVHFPEAQTIAKRAR